LGHCVYACQGTCPGQEHGKRETDGGNDELWQAIVQELGVEYELIEYNRIGQILEAFEKGELDALPALAVKASRENILDLSHAYLRSGSAMLHFSGHFVDRFVSLEFLLLIGLLVLLSFAAGALVWLFEGRRNREMFGGGLPKGLGHGIWWAMVTMTTVGYGDKAPKTFGGRIVALIWMFASIILVAGFTAAITASLTLGELSGKVRGLRDLHGVRVGAVDQSGALNFLAQRGIAALPFDNEKGCTPDITSSIRKNAA
jgi:ABC-type amino acid transport substrate-binding protein